MINPGKDPTLDNTTGQGPSAVELLNALPAARNDPDEARYLVQNILEQYGSEEHFFQAAAAELKVSPDAIKQVLTDIAKVPPKDPAQSASQGQFDQQTLPQINDQQDVQNNTPAQPVKGQPMPPMQPPAQPMNMNNRMQPPPQINAQAVGQQQGQLQGQGMAPAQAMAQAAQNPTAKMGFANGGQVKKAAYPGARPNEQLNGTQGMSKAGWFDKIKHALGQTPAGKQLLDSELHPMADKLPDVQPRVAPLAHTDTSNSDTDSYATNEIGKKYSKVIQNNPNADISDAGVESGDEDQPSKYMGGGIVGDMYSPNEQGPDMGYAEGGEVEGKGFMPQSNDEELPATAPEEMADDIDAKLSQNEFVIPAFAVKYWGIQHLNSMIKEAKENMGALESEGAVQDDDEPTAQGVKGEEGSPEEEASESPEEEKGEKEFSKGGMANSPQKLQKGGIADTNKQTGNAETIGNGNRYNKGGAVQKLACGGMPKKMAKGGFLKNEGFTPEASTPDKPKMASAVNKLTRKPRQSRTFHIPKGPNKKPYGLGKYTSNRTPDLFTK